MRTYTFTSLCLLLGFHAATALGQAPTPTPDPWGTQPEIYRAIPVPPPPASDPAREPEIRRAIPVTTPTPQAPRDSISPPEATPPAEPEIRRATPVTRPTPTPEDDREIRRAEPVRRPIPGEFSVPAPTPQPEESPLLTDPSVPARPPQPDEEDLAEAVIRVAPAEAGATPSPEQIQFDLANGFYARGLYELAAPEYRTYLQDFRRGPHRELVYFRLGESYRNMDRPNRAMNAYESLLAEFPYGEFVGPAAYRLAGLYYGEENYRAAIPLFRRAAASLDDHEVVLSARFYEARSLDRLGRDGEARLVYEQIVGMEDPNPYRDFALLAIARADSDAGRTRDALRSLGQLAEEANQPRLRREAALKAGLLAAELQETERAVSLLTPLLDDPEAGEWRDSALTALYRLHLANEESEKVLELFREYRFPTGDAERPEAMILVATALRREGRFEEAGDLYDRVQREFPGTQHAEEARYQWVVILYSRDDENTMDAAEEYLLLRPEGERADRVRLIMAERHFRDDNFAEAAPLYRRLQDSSLPEDLRNEALYKLAWSEARLGNDEEAIQAYTKFIVNASGHALQASALTQRALAYQRQGDFDAALSDFREVAERWPGGAEHELSLQQIALIHGQQEEPAAMAEAFQTLLETFPESEARAQAHYWIGWAAFEEKNYSEALPELEEARRLNPEVYEERAGMRILLSKYYLQDAEALQEEIERRLSEETPGNVPREVYRWLGLHLHQEENLEQAERFLALGVDPESSRQTDLVITLAETQLKLGKYEEARTTLNPLLEGATDPAQRARILLLQAEADLGAGQKEEARELTRQVLQLQPEGRLNARARFLSGRIDMADGDYEEAGRSFLSVAVLYEDRDLTPQALEQAMIAYRRAGDTEQSAQILDELRTRYPEHPISEVMGP